MGTIIGLIILAALDWYLVRKTGLHMPQLISKKYAEYLQDKENRKQGVGIIIQFTDFNQPLPNSFLLPNLLCELFVWYCTHCWWGNAGYSRGTGRWIVWPELLLE